MFGQTVGEHPESRTVHRRRQSEYRSAPYCASLRLYERHPFEQAFLSSDRQTGKVAALYQAATRPDIERQPCLSVCLNLRKLAQTGDVHIVSMTRNRGLNDILIVVVDGLCGFPDATQPSVQTFRQPCRPLDPQFTGFRPLERTQNLSRSA